MYKGVLKTKRSEISKEDVSFNEVLREMEMLKREHIHNDIVSIDIFENDKVVAALRLM